MSKEYTNKQIAQCVPAAYRWALVNSEIVKLLLKKNNYFTQEKYDITLAKKVSAYFLFVCILSFFSILYLYLKQFFIITDRRIKIESIILDTGHGYDHYWWNSLDNNKLKDELDLSLSFLSKIGFNKNYWTACYPYGSYDQQSIRMLKERRCKLAFTTDLGTYDLNQLDRLKVPRFDTNDFGF